MKHLFLLLIVTYATQRDTLVFYSTHTWRTILMQKWVNFKGQLLNFEHRGQKKTVLDGAGENGLGAAGRKIYRGRLRAAAEGRIFFKNGILISKTTQNWPRLINVWGRQENHQISASLMILRKSQCSFLINLKFNFLCGNVFGKWLPISVWFSQKTKSRLGIWCLKWAMQK